MKRLVLLLAATLLTASFNGAGAQFVSRGHWMLGGSASVSTSLSDNLSVSVINGINAAGYDVKVSPEVSYAIQDNMAIGVQFSYGRSVNDMTSAEAGVGDTSLEVKEYHTIGGVSIFLRNYIPLGSSGRFAMKADVGLNGYIGQGKDIDAHTGYIMGSWWDRRSIRFYVNPGFYAAITDRMYLSLNVGMANLGYVKTKQIENQVNTAGSRGWTGSCMVDLTALGLGLNFYL